MYLHCSQTPAHAMLTYCKSPREIPHGEVNVAVSDSFDNMIWTLALLFDTIKPGAMI